MGMSGDIITRAKEASMRIGVREGLGTTGAMMLTRDFIRRAFSIQEERTKRLRAELEDAQQACKNAHLSIRNTEAQRDEARREAEARQEPWLEALPWKAST